jgi:hypothetical protein
MTTRSNRLACALALAVCLVASVARAGAEPSPADVETARALYVEGLELRDKGDLQTSLSRFRAAYALAATPITSLELGRAHVLVGQLVEARDVLLQVERLPQSASESAKAQHARVEAKTLAEQLRTRISTMTITFAPPQPPRPPRVTVDGAVIPPEAIGAPRKVNPGRHAVFAELGGARATNDVVLGEGETRNVVLRLEGVIGGDTPPPPPPPPGRDDGLGPWFYVGLATAGVGVLAGSITGAVALSKASSLDKECSGTVCPKSAQSDLDTSRTMGTISTVSFVIAGIGATVALVVWLSQPKEPLPITSNGARWSW